MEAARATQPDYAEKFKARSDAAMSWARYTRAVLIIVVMVAAWQDRAFWPFLHDRMQVTYAFGLDMYDKSEGSREYLASLTNFEGGSGQSEHNFITETLLKLRN